MEQDEPKLKPKRATAEEVRSAMSRAGVFFDPVANQTFFGGTPDEVAGRLARSLAQVLAASSRSRS